MSPSTSQPTALGVRLLLVKGAEKKGCVIHIDDGTGMRDHTITGTEAAVREHASKLFPDVPVEERQFV